MKKHITTIAICMAMLLGSCAGRTSSSSDPQEAPQPTTDSIVATATQTEYGTQIYTYEDSCQHLLLKLSLELPQGSDEAAREMRRALMADFIYNTEVSRYVEDNKAELKPFRGSEEDGQAFLTHYGRTIYQYLLDLAQSDYRERISYLDTFSTLSPQERERIKADVPQWAYEQNVRKLHETEAYVVYLSDGYTYYGGAHGGVSGSGGLTFSRLSGKQIAQFVNPDATEALQPLLRRGLLQYYREYGDCLTDEQLTARLQIEGEIIPQPTQVPYPNASADSLIFTYHQYEIACYADGMPSFALSVKDLMPFLTAEAKSSLRAAK